MEATNEIGVIQQDQEIRSTFQKERGRLLNFIKKRIPDQDEAEDVLQDVFFQLVETYRLVKPVEQVTSWLFAVARNRITDLFRKKKTPSFSDLSKPGDTNGEDLVLKDVFSAFEDGPEGLLARRIIMEEFEEALLELPSEQREAFILHEVEDISFKEMSALTGASVNTLISRKRYAVLHLRGRLQEIYDEYLTN